MKIWKKFTGSKINWFVFTLFFIPGLVGMVVSGLKKDGSMLFGFTLWFFVGIGCFLEEEGGDDINM